MKEKIHPPYQEVLFVDSSTGTQFLIGSTITSDETGTFEGKEYPMVRVPISSASHPFFTRVSQFLDTEGRVDKFTKKYQRKSLQSKQEQEKQEEANKEKAQSKKKKK
jgi:large subunit ribosomal protein L31